MVRHKIELPDIVDELGIIKAEISSLQEREKTLKDLLIASNQPFVKGELFQAAISRGERVTLDSATVRGLLTPTQIKLCERVTPFVTVRVGALTDRV